MPRPGSPAARGYGYAHQCQRKRLLLLHVEGTPCVRCGKPMFTWQGLDADHVMSRPPALADALTHSTCNRSHGGKRGNEVKRAKASRQGKARARGAHALPSRTVTSRDW